uniref:P-loop containing nucleoside triphosphate hydrolase protein n=2 Tax=Pseudo-nitzschia australis TaxID=44445 RepID=A0A7S4AQQ3_9STRA
MTSYGSINVKTFDNSDSKYDVSDEQTALLPNGDTIIFENEERSGIWSKLTFGWMEPLMRLGNAKEKLDPEDIAKIPLPHDGRTDHLRKSFVQAWGEEVSKAKARGGKSEPSLMMVLARAYGFDCIVGGFVLKFIHDSCVFVGPKVLNDMILFLESDEYPLSYGLSLALAVTASQLAMSFCLRHYFMKCYKFGLKIRTAIMVAVYQKALVLSAGERHNRSLGEITNLMSIDAQRLQELTTYLHAVWFSFYQIGLAMFLLWQQLGPSALAGLAVICIMIPVTKTIAKIMGRLQKKLMISKDERVDVNSEVLGAMKVVKLQAWEGPFIDRIMNLRDKELQDLQTYVYANCLSLMLWGAVPVSVSLATFACYVFLGNNLDVATALTSVALFEILRFPLFMLPQIINRIVEAGISLERVRSFLLCDEHERIGEGDLKEKGNLRMSTVTAIYESLKPPSIEGDMGPMNKEVAEKKWEMSLLQSQLEEAELKIKELTDLHNRKDGKQLTGLEAPEDPELVGTLSTSMLSLKRINFVCKPGELIAVIGGVGSGKSSFLNGILGELRILSGKTEVKGKLAFFSQNPFIMNATVKANILFSHVDEPVDEVKYQRAIESCALKYDLEMLPAGDQTEIGEKGITLSGGQKARVALARTVYHGGDISLIDDALSAVDAHVAKHLFEECITKDLLAGAGNTFEKRSVILATNALQHLNHPRVDRIVVLREGRIIEQGSYKELSEDKSSEFSRFLSVIEETGVKPSITDKTIEDIEDDFTGIADDIAVSVRKSERSIGSKKDNSKLMTIEERSTGHVGIDVYLYWARAAGGVWVAFIIILAFVAAEFIGVLSKWWLTYWSAHGTENNQMYFLGIYGLINLMTVVGLFLRIIFILMAGLRASRKIYSGLLQIIMHAPMSFFDTTPIGRIINRFGQDMYTIDSQIVTTLRSYISTILSVVSALVVNAGVSPAFTISIIPLVFYYAAQQKFFTMTYRELKRLDSVSRSPIYALLGETIDGVATIRAHAGEASLTLRLENMLDVQQNAYYLLCVAQCWLAIRLELVGTLIITLACLFPIWHHEYFGADPKFAGLAGIAISYALSITQSLNWSVRMASDLEASMISVERVRSYCQVESEASRDTNEDTRLPESWPSGGSIVFKNASLRYRPGLPRVLKGLDIELPKRSKIGVVGRTGAGKSTLMVSLLRIVELDSGKIFIDGQDTLKIGLTKLRSNIAVIPQDPVLFSGTIRSNLDPFGDFRDDDIFTVLTRVGLFTNTKASTSTDSLSSLGLSQLQSLHDIVKEGGSNFSVGQRQLLVIARALLSGASIVIMDEATAAVDADTDARIQKVMRSEFADATCITIAHRINTIMDSDFILVMDNGKAAEFDTPKKLIAKGGMFRDLVQAASHEH